MDHTDKHVASLLYEDELQTFLAGTNAFFRETFKSFLKEVVLTREPYFDQTLRYIDNKHGNPEEWIEAVKRVAGKYLEKAALHSPWMTKYLIREVVNCQLQSLEHLHSRGIYTHYHVRTTLEYPYNRNVPPHIGSGLLYWPSGTDVLLAYS